MVSKEQGKVEVGIPLLPASVQVCVHRRMSLTLHIHVLSPIHRVHHRQSMWQTVSLQIRPMHSW